MSDPGWGLSVARLPPWRHRCYLRGMSRAESLSPQLESKAARWIPWLALCVAVATSALWWTMAYRPVEPGTVVVVERRGCDICICANPCPCDCECECSVASQKSLGAGADHRHAAP